MSELITVPTFTFNQGKIGDTIFEKPIQVEYYNGSIVLRQEGEFDQEETINVHPDFIEKFLKEIKKHKAEAEHWLNQRK